MEITMLDSVVGVSAVALAAALYLRHAQDKRRGGLSLPPGPSTFPVLGNLKLPDQPLAKSYRDLSDKLGSDIICYKIMGVNIILLNSLQVANDLLEKRSAIYSDRPESGLTMVKDLMGFAWSFVLQRYGNEWRDARKAFQHEFHPQRVKAYRSTEIRSAHILLRALLKDPQHVLHHVRMYVGRVIMYVGYAIDVLEEGDPWIARAEFTAEGSNSCFNAGAWAVDIFPILRHLPQWFPGAEFHRFAAKYRPAVMEMLHKPFDLVKERMTSSEGSPDCAARSLLENVIDGSKDPAHMELMCKSALGSAYGAGTDTTTGILQTFILAMTMYPEIQRKAQASIDRVCNGRLPDFTDYEHLPWVDAIVKECLRWNPVIPLDLPHRVMQDDVYNAYFIPKGSILVANSWAILHDPGTYPDPETFNPGRFLTMSAAGETVLNPAVPDPAVAAFGFGRRICPGRFAAYETMWAAVANILAVLDIDRAKDALGRPIVPEGEMAYVFTCHPKPFPCEVRPRSDEHITLIQNAIEHDA